MVLPGGNPEIPTPATDIEHLSPVDKLGIGLALENARLGYTQGGIPIGAALLDQDGTIISTGHNRLVQQNDPISHGEIDCLRSAGRLPASTYARCTMYTTLSPCPMCSGACVFFGIRRVVIGENRTLMGAESFLRERGVEVINLDLDEPREMMLDFIRNHPDVVSGTKGEP
ncbi:cytosine deaminase, zinc metalloenzyme that catalyzes the hydrolytic deamination of cytosine to urac [Hymenopellis radicata]|nr:cytosine deaminase, zinc metalloenzyme that catalyzes the hydrolytic deamination of cytosine to urac [Hymenopellis radicata]